MGQSGNLTVLPATRQMPTLSDAIGSLSDTISGRRKAQQEANQAQVKARADSLLQMAKNLTPDQYREVRMKVIAGDPAVAPYLPDVPQYTPSAEENFKTQFTTRATSALDTMPQGAMQQGAYQMGTGAAMPSDTVQLTNAQDVTGNPDKWSAAVQERQAIGDKRSLDARQIQEGKQFEKGLTTPTANARLQASTQVQNAREQNASAEKIAGMRATDATKSKPSSAVEKRSLGFYLRAKDAIDQLEGVESESGKPLHEAVGNKGTLEQFWLNKAPNFVQPEENQLYIQAQRQFTEARLRKDSGAAIPEHEYVNDRRTYFAQPGDTPQVIARKRAARENLLKSLKMESGRAYGEYFGEGSEPSAANTVSVSKLEALARKEGKTVGQLIQEAKQEGLQVVP